MGGGEDVGARRGRPGELPLDEYGPDPENPRTISDAARRGLGIAMKEYGDLSGLVWNRRTKQYVTGHQRLGELRGAGAKTWAPDADGPGWGRIVHPETGEVFRIRIVDWDPEKQRAANLIANNPEVAGVFTEAAAAQLEGLSDRLANFGDLQLGALLERLRAEMPPPPRVPGSDEDAVPEAPETPATRRGDLWVLGRHRLLCGDSAAREDLDRLLGGQLVQLVNSDPPYNVRVEPRSNNAIAAARAGQIDIAGKSMPRLGPDGHNRRQNANWDAAQYRAAKAAAKAAGKTWTGQGSAAKKAALRKAHGSGHNAGFDDARFDGKQKPTGRMRAKDRPLVNDFLPPEEFAQLLRTWFRHLADALEPGRSAYIWGGYGNWPNYPAAFAEAGFYFSHGIIWVKQHPVLTRKDFMGNFECAWYGWKEGAAHWFNPEITNATDTWEVKKVSPNKMVHLIEKPVELASRAILYSSPHRGDRVLDLFGGSGSTLIACEKAERDARLMEMDPAYCDVILGRWQEYAGAAATLDGDGRSFAEVAAARAKETSA